MIADCIARAFRIVTVIVVGVFGLVAAGSLVVQPSMADVQKVLFVCVKGKTKEICPQLRASLKAPEGWTIDKIAASKQGRVVWVPNGKTYETAPYTLTALTQLKGKLAIDTIAERDRAALKQKFGDLTVAPMKPIVNPKLGGKVEVSRLDVPSRKAHPFELEARFEDKDAEDAVYVVELSLMATTEKGLKEARPKFEAMIKGY